MNIFHDIAILELRTGKVIGCECVRTQEPILNHSLRHSVRSAKSTEEYSFEIQFSKSCREIDIEPEQQNEKEINKFPDFFFNSHHVECVQGDWLNAFKR